MHLKGFFKMLEAYSTWGGDSKKVLEELGRRNQLLELINNLFEEIIKCETSKDVAKACLAAAEEITGSKFGFIGEINPAGRLDTIAISKTGWKACEIPMEKAVGVVRNMELRGIWSRTLKKGRTDLVNDPDSHPNRVGLPEGHPPISSFLGVPLKLGGKTFGMFALANKEGGYTDTDRENIEALSATFVECLIHKRIEEDLRESNKRFEDIAVNASEWIWEVDADGLYTYVNPAVKNILGYKPEEIIGEKHFYDLFPPDVREDQKRAAFEVFSRKESFRRFYNPNLHKDGNLVILETSGVPILDDDNNLAGYRGLDIDITDRKKAERERENLIEELQMKTQELTAANEELEVTNEELETKSDQLQVANEELQTRGEELESTNEELRITNEELEQTAAELEKAKNYVEEWSIGLEKKVEERTGDLLKANLTIKQIYEGMSSGIMLIDTDYTVKAVNSSFVKMSGIDKEKMVGMKCYQLLPRLDCRTDKCLMKHALTGKDEVVQDVTVVGDDGAVKKYLITAKPFKDEKGKITGVIEDIRDVTEIKSLEEKVQRTEKLAIIGKLAGSVSHELRNPLSVIKNAIYYLTMPKNVVDKEKEKRHLEIIKRQADAADGIISNILDFARHKKLDLEEADISEIVEGALESVVLPQNVTIEKEYGEGLKGFFDRVLIGRACSNIIINGIQSLGDEGTLRITTERDADYAKITVEDDGEGIPEASLDEVFDPLYSTKIKGVGLGLTVVRDAVDRHGGTIDLKSRVGKGTRIVLRLPLKGKESR